MNLLDWKHKLLGRPYRCGGGGDTSSSDSDASFESDWGSVTSGGFTAAEQAAAGGGGGGFSFGNAGGAPSNSDAAFESDWSSATGGGFTAAEQAAQQAAAASGTNTYSELGGGSVTVDRATGNVVSSTPGDRDALAQARADELMGIFPGLTREDALALGYVGVTPEAQRAYGKDFGFGMHSPNMDFATLGLLNTLGFGAAGLDAFGYSNQTVSQALASKATSDYLGRNIGTIMGTFAGNPALGALVQSFADLGQGRPPGDVIANTVAGLLAQPLSTALGFAVPASAVSAAVKGQYADALYNTAVANIARSAGLQPAAVASALNGQFGTALAQHMSGQLVREATTALTKDAPMLAGIVGPIAAQFGKPVGTVLNEIMSPLNTNALSLQTALREAIPSGGGLLGLFGGAGARGDGESGGAGASGGGGEGFWGNQGLDLGLPTGPISAAPTSAGSALGLLALADSGAQGAAPAERQPTELGRFVIGEAFDPTLFTGPMKSSGTGAAPVLTMAAGGYLGESDGPRSLDDLLRELN